MRHVSFCLPALALSLLVGASACAYGPEVPTMQADPVCHVWTTSGMGRASVRVPGNDAQLYAGMGKLEGRWINETTFSVDAGADVVGTFDGSRMLIDTIFGFGEITATIQPPAAHIDGAFGGVDVASNAACDARGIALGTAVIVVAIALQS